MSSQKDPNSEQGTSVKVSEAMQAQQLFPSPTPATAKAAPRPATIMMAPIQPPPRQPMDSQHSTQLLSAQSQPQTQPQTMQRQQEPEKALLNQQQQPQQASQEIQSQAPASQQLPVASLQQQRPIFSIPSSGQIIFPQVVMPSTSQQSSDQNAVPRGAVHQFQPPQPQPQASTITPSAPIMSPTKPAEALIAMAHGPAKPGVQFSAGIPTLTPSMQPPSSQPVQPLVLPQQRPLPQPPQLVGQLSMQPPSQQSGQPPHGQQSSAAAPARKKQRRYRANPEQLKRLVALFEENMSPPASQLAALAKEIDMPQQSVVLWFKNRRARVPAKKAKAAAAATSRKHDDENSDGAAGSTRGRAGAGTGTRTNMSRERTPPPTWGRTGNAGSGREKSGRGGVKKSMPPMSLDIPPIDAPTSQGFALSPVPRSSPRLREKAAQLMAAHQQNPSAKPPPLLMLLTAAGTLESPKKPPGSARRPRVPMTPRIISQRDYRPGDEVEVLETGKGYVRSWYSAKIIEKKGGGFGSGITPTPLSLGVSAAGNVSDDSGRKEPGSKDNGSVVIGGYSMRSPKRRVSSPLASPTPAAAKARYRVQYEHIVTELETMEPLVETITASRLRPRPPRYSNWRPQVGEAVEALSNEAAWFTGVVRAYAVRKGFLVTFEGDQKIWYRRYQLRPHQIWRGGDDWIIKTKPPAALAKKSAGMYVTVPQQQKAVASFTRKRSREDNVGGFANGKRRRTAAAAAAAAAMPTGPEGLPEGWKVAEVTRGGGSIMNGRKDKFYTAPDGKRIRSLKEARKYVKVLAAQER